MKKVLLMTFVACFAMMFGSCQKDLDLIGTTWKAHDTVNQQITEEGVTATAELTYDYVLNFIDATTGKMTITYNGTVSAMGMTFPINNEPISANYTYTFDGENGTITTAEEDDNVTMPFTYNKKDKTILISINEKDEEMGLDINLDLVFTQE